MVNNLNISKDYDSIIKIDKFKNIVSYDLKNNLEIHKIINSLIKITNSLYKIKNTTKIFMKEDLFWCLIDNIMREYKNKI